jgi:hypothetical protein
MKETGLAARRHQHVVPNQQNLPTVRKVMSHLRNVAFNLLALGCLASASYAGDVSNGKFTATYLGPSNQISNGAPLACINTTHCSFVRDGVVPPGQSRIAIMVTTTVDNYSVHLELGAWAASGCGPDPMAPDLTGTGDLPLPTAGRWIIHFATEDILTAGTPFSQKFAISSTDLSVDCGPSYCVNSLAGNPGAAPADCEQP